MAGHARLSPSAADWWMLCPGGPNFVEGLPEEAPNRFAAEGSVAHLIRSESLELGLDPFDFVGQKITYDGFEFEVTDEMADFLQPGIDECREWDGKEFIEHKISLERWLPGQFGTLDYGKVGHKLIRINDLKYGAGIPVSPIENRQLMLYALGFWDTVANDLTFAETFELSIDQPRAAAGGGTWTITKDELMEFGGAVKAAGKATLNPDAPRVPGPKQCQWCRGKDFCPEYAAYNLKTVSQKFDDLDANAAIEAPPALPKAVTPEQRGYIIQNAAMFTDFLERLHADALADALAGRPTPGHKAVLGRAGKRVWRDQDEATFAIEPIFGEDSFTKKLISPTQVEKKLGKARYGKEISKLVTQADPAPILVPDSNRKEAIKPISEQFEDLT